MHFLYSYYFNTAPWGDGYQVEILTPLLQKITCYFQTSQKSGKFSLTRIQKLQLIIQIGIQKKVLRVVL